MRFMNSLRRSPRILGGSLVAVLLTSCSLFRSDVELPSDRDGFINRILLAEDGRAIDDPILAHALLHEDPVVRRYAYRALGRIGDTRGLGVLFKTASAEALPGLRAEAVYAMGLHRHPTVVDMAERFILDESPAVRGAVMRALGACGDERALMALLDGVEDPEALVRGEAALGVARLAREQKGSLAGRSFAAFSRLAYRVLEEPMPDVRWRMAYAASLLKRPELQPTLAEATRDPEVRVRVMACAGLSDLNLTPASVRALLIALNDERWVVAVEAAKALKGAPAGLSLDVPDVTADPRGADRSPDDPALADPALVDPAAAAGPEELTPLPEATTEDAVLVALCRVLGEGGVGGHPSHHVRAAAASSLGAFAVATHGDALSAASRASIATVLLSARGDRSPTVVAAAFQSYARVSIAADPGGEEVLAVCRRLLETSTEDLVGRFVRAQVAEVAAGLPDAAGLPIVRSLLADPATAVRAAAIAALPRFPAGIEEAERILADALVERDVALRDASAIAAGELGRAALAGPLRAALYDSDGADYVEPRISILKALGILIGADALPTLRESLRDPEAAVRAAARLQIAALGGELPRMPRVPPPERVVHPRPGRDLLLSENPRVTIVTSKGPIVLELLADEAPVHSAAFLDRCRSGFYDGLPFHRLVPGFVVQGLDPRGDGYGGGGHTLRGEVNAMRFDRGVVGMPDSGPDTGGCQIFITFRPQPRLDDRYTVFARVEEGMDVVDRLDVGDQVDYVVLKSES